MLLQAEAGLDDEVYQSLQHALTEVENSKQEAYEEARRRQKAEREAMEAMRKVSGLFFFFLAKFFTLFLLYHHPLLSVQ